MSVKEFFNTVLDAAESLNGPLIPRSSYDAPINPGHSIPVVHTDAGYCFYATDGVRVPTISETLTRPWVLRDDPGRILGASGSLFPFLFSSVMQADPKHVSHPSYEELVEIEEPHPDIMVCLGGELDGIEWLTRHYKGILIVYEPDPGVIRATSYLPHGELFSRENLFFCSTWRQLEIVFLDQFRDGMSARVTSQGHVPDEAKQDIADRLQVLIYKILANVKIMREKGKKRTLAILDNFEQLTKNPYVSHLRDVCKGIPAIVAAAGPSLDDAIPYLREASKKAVLIAVDAALVPLMKAGIHPHIVCTLESNPTSAKMITDGAPWDGILVTCEYAQSDVYNYPCHKFMSLQGSFGPSVDVADGLCRHLLNTSSTVSSMALQVARIIGAHEISFVGLDLALHEGRYYAGGISAGWDIGWGADRRETEDVFGKTVTTNLTFLQARLQMENTIACTEGVKFTNRSYGAKIEGAPHESPSELQHLTSEIDIAGALLDAWRGAPLTVWNYDWVSKKHAEATLIGELAAKGWSSELSSLLQSPFWGTYFAEELSVLEMPKDKAAARAQVCEMIAGGLGEIAGKLEWIKNCSL